MGKDWTPRYSEKAGWHVSFSIKGQRFRHRLGIRDKGSKALAQRAARAYYQAAWDRILNPPTVQTSPPFYTAAQGYVDAGGEARFLPKIMAHLGPDPTIADLDSAKIDAIATALYPNAAPDTHRRQVVVPINAVIRWARGERRRPSTDVRRMRWLTPEEMERLIDAATKLTLPRHQTPERFTLQKIAFLIGTGARPGECFATDVAGWNPATRQWWLDGEATGAGKTALAARWVRLPQRAVDLIGTLPEVGRAFLTPYGKPYQLRRNGGGQMAASFNAARDAAGLGRDVTPYVLRHTWATWHSAQTRDFGALMDQGGWAKADMALRYRKAAPDDLADRMLAHGWDFRQKSGNSDASAEIVQLNQVDKRG